MVIKPVTNHSLFFEMSEAANGVFGSQRWLSVYGNSLILMGIYKDENQLIGGFYHLSVKKYGLNFLKLPPYTPHCGLFFVSGNSNKSSANSFLKEVITSVCDYFNSLKPALTVIAFPYRIIDLQPFIWQKYKVVPNYTYLIDLTRPLKDIVSDFDSKNRNAINKAIKENVETRTNQLNSDELYRHFYNTLKEAGAQVYKKELLAIFKNFMDACNSFSIAAYKQNELLGVVFCVYDKRNCYYLLGGVNKKAGLQGVNNLLVQRSIEMAKEIGCVNFDFEGSMLKGVEKFFRGFGPGLVPYYTVNKASLPLEMMLKFKKRELF